MMKAIAWGNHILIHKPKNAQTHFAQSLISFSIAFFLFIPFVNAAIQFNDQIRLVAIEIDNEPGYNLLSSKVNS